MSLVLPEVVDDEEQVLADARMDVELAAAWEGI